MSIPFQALVKRSTLLKYGLLGVAAGIGVTIFGFASDQSMPERAALQKVEGEMTGAKKITTTRKRGGSSVKYELEIKAANGAPIMLTIPEREITETQVRSLFRTKLIAEYDGESDVYAIASNGRPVITYENSVKNRKDGNRFLEGLGAAIASLSALFAGLGYWWTRRKMLKEYAAWEAQQAQQSSTATPAA
ncbi:MAG: hypothetical protein ACRCTI_02005 [Beijerinckiaceae bacterium]